MLDSDLENDANISSMNEMLWCTRGLIL
jgi:hypothetical protein